MTEIVIIDLTEDCELCGLACYRDELEDGVCKECLENSGYAEGEIDPESDMDFLEDGEF